MRFSLSQNGRQESCVLPKDLKLNFPRSPALFAISLFFAVAAGFQSSHAQDKSPSQFVSTDVSDAQIEKAIEGLDEVARTTLQRSGIPGMAVAVTWKGETVFAKGYGVREVGSPDAVDADTVFQLASLSKSIAGTVVAAKVGDGLVSWRDPVIRYLPGFRLKDPDITKRVTLGDLFSHRSGLPGHAGDDLEDLGYTQATIFERLHLLPLGAFRLDYAYTNFGLTAAAQAVAHAANTDWPTLSETAIYKPLGMARTSSRFSDFIERENRAMPHVRDNGGFESLFQRNPDEQTPAGGVSSTAHDFARWMAMVLGEGKSGDDTVVAADALLQAARGEVISSPAKALDDRTGLYGYGMGISTSSSGRVLLSHSGAFTLGAATSYLMVPSLDLGIVVLTNAEPFGVPESLAYAFVETVELGAPTRDWLSAYGQAFAPLSKPFGKTAGEQVPGLPAPAKPLAVYEGGYANDYFGLLQVAVKPGGLVLTLGPDAVEFALTHWDGDTFVFPIRTENAPAGSRSLVRFSAADEGKSSSVWVEFFDEYGLGTFTR